MGEVATCLLAVWQWCTGALMRSVHPYINNSALKPIEKLADGDAEAVCYLLYEVDAYIPFPVLYMGEVVAIDPGDRCKGAL